jgi:glycosyltransferase involved in cell wall biosynthesis
VKTFSCGAAYGSGGLGRHLAELVEESRRDGSLARYYSSSPLANDESGVAVRVNRLGRFLPYTPARFSPGWSTFVGFDLFDRASAGELEPASRHVAFSLQALHSFSAARARGCEHLDLISPTCHVDTVKARYADAFRQHPIERPWLNGAACRKAKHEYRTADTITVASTYVRESFLAAGYSEERLGRFDLSADPRFAPEPRRIRTDETFRVVYVGALSVAKGIPVLLDAFTRLAEPEASLTLVGGWGTRPMRRYIEEALVRDPRVTVTSGDPLPHLQRGDVYVHPSYQDGSPYAPLEALACGLPVILTEDTGTKELIREGENGVVVPTGDANAITEALEEAHRRLV